MKRLMTALVLSALTCTLSSNGQETPSPDQPEAPPPPPAAESAEVVPAPEPAPVPPVEESAPAPAPETPAPEGSETPAPAPTPTPTPEPPAAAPAPGQVAVPPAGVVTVPPTVAPVGPVAPVVPAPVVPVVEATPVPTPAPVPVVEAAPVPAPAEEPAPDPATPLGNAEAAAEVIPLIQIEDVPLTDAIRNLARQANLNFQFDPRVTASNQPNVSIRFENVTAAEALQAVLDNYDLQLTRDPRTRIARITIKDPKADEPLVSKIVQLKYSDPTNMVALIRPNLSLRSQVIADPRTSQLIVTTTEKELTAVEELINRLDTATKQVLIEAHIFETAHNPSTVKGIDWSGTLEAQQIQFGNNTRDALPFERGQPPSPQNPLGTPDRPPVFGREFDGGPRLAVNTASGFYPPIGFLNADGVSAVLSFLNKDTDTEVVATPRAVTLDNQMATLSITRAFPIFLITPGSANTPGGSQINYTNLGTILYVTPRIAADNNISLRVAPEVSNIDSVDRKVIQNTVNEANVYAIRRIETHVMIPSGNTLVMGGLMNDTKTKSYTKVPVLGDIPVLGWAFRKEGKVRNKSNLLIFVTPTIVTDEAYNVTSSGTEFLKTRPTTHAEVEDSAWDSAKPHDWTKPVD